jgi:DHA1 family tetracycline resistance protein-like MFS transporter
MHLAIGGVVLYVCGLGLIAVSGGLAVALAGLALCAVGGGAFIPCASAIASRQAEASERGVVMGTYQVGASLARAVIPLASGTLYASLGPSAPFMVGACLTAPAAWLVRHAARQPARA